MNIQDVVDDGLDAIERFIEEGNKLVPEKGGFVVLKANGVRYIITPNFECDCQSRRDCYHLKVARLIKALTG